MGKDVCRCVGISHPTRSMQSVDKEDKVTMTVATNGGKQQATYVNESGLYQLIFMGKTEKAKNFRRWVTKTVIPTIRRTGEFKLPEGVESVQEMNEIQRMVDQYLNAYRG